MCRSVFQRNSSYISIGEMRWSFDKLRMTKLAPSSNSPVILSPVEGQAHTKRCGYVPLGFPTQQFVYQHW